MDLSTLLIILTIVGCFIALAWFLQKSMSQKKTEQELESVVAKVFGLTAEKIAMQSKQILDSEKEIFKTDLANKERSIQRIVEQLKGEIDERQKEIRGLEQDRNKSFSAIREALVQHQEITKDLKTTTESLTKVLSNNQQRGEWGERIIEDLLRSSGLVEGVHYLKQTKLGETTARPDITLLLPNERVVPIDVKFPFSEIQKLSLAETKALREQHEKQFARDIREKIKKVATYIKPEEDTLDYAIMFVPNEMIFSFINQHYPELITEAIEQRVMIVSPFTFLIVARTIMESYRNFMMESNLRKIVKNIGEFASEWQRFIDEFDKFGMSIDKLEQNFRQIRDTRHKQMSRKISRIEEFQQQSSKSLKLE